jgi:hypothetical protein
MQNIHSVCSTPAETTEFLESLSDWKYWEQDYSTYLKEKVSDPQETLNMLNECMCCSRHTIYRPKVLGPWTNTICHGNQDNSCPCSCRHTARWICRAFQGGIGYKRPREDNLTCEYIKLDKTPTTVSPK